MALGSNQIAAYAADLLDLEDQIEALQDGKRELYKTIREEHTRLAADSIKNAVRIMRMDSEKRERFEATDAETARVLSIIEASRAPAPARTREIIEEFRSEPETFLTHSDGLAGPANAADERTANTKPAPIHEPAIAADPAGEGLNNLSPREAEPSSADNFFGSKEPDWETWQALAGYVEPAHPAAGGSGETPEQTGTVPLDAVPVTYTPTAADNARKLRPFCQHADDLSKCAGQGKKHCWECQKAHADEAGEAA